MKINVTITVEDEAAISFIKNRGWVETVTGEPDAEGNPTTVPNPETAKMAIAAYAKNILVEQLGVDRVNEMNRQLNTSREAGLAEIKAAASSMLVVEVE